MGNFGKLNFSVSFNRTSAFPIEANSYFTDLEQAEAAAKTAVEPGSADSTYYIGLTLTVADETDCNLYIIKPDLSLKRLTILDTSDVAWESILNKPTTIGGFGITDAYTKTEADDRYVNVSGDTMTDNLFIQKSGRNDKVELFSSGTINQCGLTLYSEDGNQYELKITTTELLWKNNKVWHEGNDGSGSGLDADLLDGKHYTDIVNGNVSSATKLQTPRTIWGQSFDGTANVSGELFGAGGAINIEFINEVNSYNGNLYLNHRGDGGGGRGTTSHVVMCCKGGNVGIGTESPSYKLHVNGTAFISNALYTAENTPIFLRYTQDTYTSGIGYDTYEDECMAFGVKNQTTTFKFKVGFDWATFCRGTFTNRTDSELEIGKGYVSMSCGHTSQSLKFENNNEINCYNGDLWLNGRNTGNIVACYNGGNVGIGTNSPSQKLHVSGNILATGFYEESDVQLKTNIQPIDFTNNIELVSFNWKKDGSKSYGVIAQQVELYYPELVSTDESTGYKSVNYDAVLIIKCALLENRIKQLEKELEDLKYGKDCN